MAQATGLLATKDDPQVRVVMHLPFSEERLHGPDEKGHLNTHPLAEVQAFLKTPKSKR